jgi:hypothetical protein
LIFAIIHVQFRLRPHCTRNTQKLQKICKDHRRTTQKLSVSTVHRAVLLRLCSIKQPVAKRDEDADDDQGAPSTDVSRINAEPLLIDSFVNRHLDASAQPYNLLFSCEGLFSTALGRRCASYCRDVFVSAKRNYVIRKASFVWHICTAAVA